MCQLAHEDPIAPDTGSLSGQVKLEHRLCVSVHVLQSVQSIAGAARSLCGQFKAASQDSNDKVELNANSGSQDSKRLHWPW